MPRLLVLLSLLLTAFLAHAQPNWDESAPLPEDYDWVRLTSGEWLKGEVRALYDETLEFDSDVLDLLTLDWEDVAEIRTARVMSVRFNDGSTGVGRLLMCNDKLSFNADANDTHSRAEIMSMAAGAEYAADNWSAKLNLGGNYKRGNTTENAIDANLNIKRRTNNSRFGFNYLSTYRKVENIETENSHRINSSYDVFLTQKLFWRPLTGEYFRDDFQNIRHRATLGTGIGYHIINSARTNWDISAGPGYQYTRFVSVAEGESQIEQSAVMMLETAWDYELTGDIDFNALYNVQFTDEASGRYKHHALLGMEYELTDDLDFNVSVIWDYTEVPQRDEDGELPEQDDTRLSIGVGYEF